MWPTARRLIHAAQPNWCVTPDVRRRLRADPFQVHSMVRQLVLMGFCVIQDGVVDPMAAISWDKQKREWVAPVKDEAEPPTVCVFMAPLVHSNGTALMSYGSAALPVWYHLSALTENMRRRDAFNSAHTVFTSVNPSMTPGDSLTPSFIAARGRAVGAADPDYTTSDRRHELLGDLMRRSNGLRSHGDVFMAGQGFPVDSRAPKLHSEHFVTDGKHQFILVQSCTRPAPKSRAPRLNSQIMHTARHPHPWLPAIFCSCVDPQTVHTPRHWTPFDSQIVHTARHH